ncbi:hypothetical protein [Paraoerskovia sediminicola]|uniref:hypothetical protein n=1 Tax=Paraoerskovia sediminicola TaxID=1138587 RepID=UPI002572CF7F|nr:hypothetical protein [Paraoerskovia sediminicola]
MPSHRTLRLFSAIVVSLVVATTVRPRPERDLAPTPDTACRACGWELGEPAWSCTGPHFVVCDCCGAESGVDDLTPTQARDYRRRWVENGAVWFDPERRPESWDLYAQLSTLPDTGA